MLIAEVEKHCMRLRKSVTLTFYKKNQEAINLYKNLGYAVISSENLKNVKCKNFEKLY